VNIAIVVAVPPTVDVTNPVVAGEIVELTAVTSALIC
jgi:hypothetical protein